MRHKEEREEKTDETMGKSMEIKGKCQEEIKRRIDGAKQRRKKGKKRGCMTAHTMILRKKERERQREREGRTLQSYGEWKISMAINSGRNTDRGKRR